MRAYLRAGGDRRLAALRRFALSITVFNVAGHTLLGFEQAWAHPIVTVVWVYLLELALETVDAWVQRRPARFLGGWAKLTDFLLPGHIAGLAISMLLYPNARFTPLLFAATVCVVSKYLVRAPVAGRSRHVLNPSNAGIAATLLVFPSVGISPPYHFTENLSGALNWIVPLAVLASGLVLNHKLTGKTPLICGWVGGFVGQALVRSAVFGTPLVAALLPLTGLTFMLFTTYMITDPGTTPWSRHGQVAFGLAVAAVYGLLVALHVVFGLFFALVIVCAGRGLCLHARAWALSVAGRRVPVVTPAGPEVRPS